MDSITHTLVGAGIGAVASQTLNLSGNEELIITGAAILASNIQDFDVVTKVFGNITFINHHRGETHMLRWLPVISLLIAVLFSWMFRVDLGIVFLVSFISLLLHIGLDSLNSYGTKLTEGNLTRLGVIHTYDLIFIITLLVSTLARYIFNVNMYLDSFIFLGVYLLARVLIQQVMKYKLLNKYNPSKILIMAKGDSFSWNIVLELDRCYLVFDYRLGKELNKDYIVKEIVDSKFIELHENTDVISAFKGISPIYIIKKEVMNEETIIRYIDLRYRHKGNYYFNAIYILNQKNECIRSSIGWDLKQAVSL